MAQRKIPMRKDIVTGEMKPKKELVRVEIGRAHV